MKEFLVRGLYRVWRGQLDLQGLERTIRHNYKLWAEPCVDEH